MRAFYRALQAAFGIKAEDGMIRPAGKTDSVIVKDLLAHFDLEERWESSNAREALFASYLGFLEDEMSKAKEDGRMRVLPGVINLLEVLSSLSDFAVGLATGNLEKGAHIKLQKAGLISYFRFGGYGSDSEDRTELIRTGIRRGAHIVAPESVESAVVIGDTPLDIVHGHAAGALVIAVASAGYGIHELGTHDPDFLVPDLTQVDSIVSFMRKGIGG